MTKKRLTLSTVAILLALAIGLGAFFAIRAYQRNTPSFTVRDTLPDGEGKRVTVILLAGQSNASGCSRDDCLRQKVSPEKYAEYQSGYDNVYINYFASGTNESGEFVRCATGQGEAGGHFGPELGMAEKLHELYPDETFFIIKYAWGGTNLHTQWLSPSGKGKTGKLYRAFREFVWESLRYLKAKNYEVEIAGMCWMQGESDSFSVPDASAYGERLLNLQKDVRKEFSRYAGEDGIRFVDAYIADNPVFWVYCDIVNEEKRKAAEASPLNRIIDTHDLLTTEEPEEAPDIPHYDSLSEITLGHRFIEALVK